MRTLADSTAAVLVGFGAMYLVGAFFAADFIISNWEKVDRALFAFLGTLIGATGGILVFLGIPSSGD